MLGKRQGVRPEETEGLLNNSSGCLIPGCNAGLPVTWCVTHQVNKSNFVHIPKELHVVRHKMYFKAQVLFSELRLHWRLVLPEVCSEIFEPKKIIFMLSGTFVFTFNLKRTLNHKCLTTEMKHLDDTYTKICWMSSFFFSMGRIISVCPFLILYSL